MRFDDRFLEELKSRLRPSDVVGKTVKLRRQGREYAGLSPFTKEKSPSFFVNDEKGFYHCFSSGKHGDIISFLQETERLTFSEAVERLAAEAGMSLPAVGLHLAAGALVLAVTFGFFSQGWIGGGDAKLAAATALWFGFDHLLDYVTYASLFGGVLTLLLIQFRKLPLPAVLARQKWILRLHETDGGVPYGIALAAAALIVYPKTDWMHGLGL